MNISQKLFTKHCTRQQRTKIKKASALPFGSLPDGSAKYSTGQRRRSRVVWGGKQTRGRMRVWEGGCRQIKHRCMKSQGGFKEWLHSGETTCGERREEDKAREAHGLQCQAKEFGVRFRSQKPLLSRCREPSNQFCALESSLCVTELVNEERKEHFNSPSAQAFLFCNLDECAYSPSQTINRIT